MLRLSRELAGVGIQKRKELFRVVLRFVKMLGLTLLLDPNFLVRIGILLLNLLSGR